MRRVSAVGGLVAAAHPGPALAVTVLSGLLAVAEGLDAGATALLVVTVLCGQLTVGWSNDLLDAGRDRSVGRTDKPLATGRVSERTVRTALAAAIVATLVLSPLNGLAAGAVHLLIVASAWSYNLGLKATAFSWVPYAVSFGGLPVFVAAAADPPALPPLWLPVAGALLGVGAHVVNVLPDLEDDAATGVRGLPHRLGRARALLLAVAVLVAASVVVAAGAAVTWWVLGPALLLVAGLAALAVVTEGKAPFRAAVGIALVDVLMLVWAR